MAQIRRLLSDWMLVEVEPEKKKTRGGIIIPDTTNEPVRVGRVLMAGPGRQYVDKLVPMPDIIGQRVAFMIAASQTKKGQAVRSQLALSPEQEIIRLGDVLFVVEGDAEIEITK